MSSKNIEEHPNPEKWWKTIKRQSWICLLALIAEGIALIAYGLPDENSETPLIIINLALLGGFISYNGGSALIDIVKAWRNPNL